MELMNPRERRYLENRLKKQHGVENAFGDLLLIKAGQGRIRAATREVFEAARRLRKVQQLGLYVAKISRGDVFLSIEGSQLLNGEITKNVIELDEEAANKWMKASPITAQMRYDSRYVVAKTGDLYLGSGRVTRDGKIYPQIAKWRRIPAD